MSAVNVGRSRHQTGFGAIMAVVILVMLASLAAAVVRLSWSSQTGSASDINSARARQAAKAGVEWGLYQALRGSWSGCTASTQTLDLRSATGMWVTVTCASNATPYVEGGDDTGAARAVRIYTIEATACNGTAACPDNTAAVREGYVERRSRSSVSDVSAQP
jgi:MSHA biogenesis protein MshP